MNVLVANWSWYPSGGDWTYIDNLRRLYAAHGHTVIPFSTKNDKNVTAEADGYFINSPDFKQLNKKKNPVNAWRAIRSSVVSSEALTMLDRILKEHKIGLAHLHNIHHYITPAIIRKLRDAGVKIVWTLHDGKILCPDSLFISNGKVCEKCLNGSFYHCALNLCKKGSLAASALAAFEAYYYRHKHIYDLVDAFLCPSEFMRNKFIQGGFPAEKFHVTNLCYDIPKVDQWLARHPVQQEKEDYALFVGRVESIKGIDTLLDAVKGTGMRLKIVGGGQQFDAVKERIETEGITGVELTGFKTQEEVFALLQGSRFMVCPSVVYENYPFSVIESFLFSKPAVGARIGGIPELVIEGKTGFLATPGNAEELKRQMLTLWNEPGLAANMGKTAREMITGIVSFEKHWQKLEPIIMNEKAVR